MPLVLLRGKGVGTGSAAASGGCWTNKLDYKTTDGKLFASDNYFKH